MTDESVIASLVAAVDSRPDDVPLRLHLAVLLLEAGRGAEAITQLGHALTRDPGNARAQELMQSALRASVSPAQTAPAVDEPPGLGGPSVADRPAADDDPLAA